MRIAYVTETFPPELNGVALTVERAVRQLRTSGHRVDLIRPRQPHEAARNDEHEWRTHGLPIPMYRDLRFGLAFSATLRRRFARSEPHIVHVATPGVLGHAALRAARQLGIPVTADFRTNFHQYSAYYACGWAEPLIHRYLRSFHNRAAVSFVPTHTLRRQLLAQGFERLQVIGRGVDIQLFSPERRSTELRTEWLGAGGEGPVLLYVGRLAAEKNVPLALRTFEAIRQQLPSARMVVVGDGPMRQRWQAAHPQVRFVGLQRREALARHYASADIFLFPSLSDTFGNVTLEALASGLAVVAFDAAAAGEHIVDGVNGVLAPPGDEAAFVRGALDLALHHRTLAAMRQRARYAALAARWPAVLRRFETVLVQTAHALETHRPADPGFAGQPAR